MYNMRIIDLSSTITPNSRREPLEFLEDGDCFITVMPKARCRWKSFRSFRQHSFKYTGTEGY